MYTKTALFIVLLFSLGWVSNSLITGIFVSESPIIESTGNSGSAELSFDSPGENNDSEAENNARSLVEEFERLLAETPEERDKDSPHDWISMDQIKVYNDRVILEIDNPEWSVFTNTKSMDPVIDGTSNAIEVIPQNEDDIHVGDIVAYRSKFRDGVITHRVVEIGSDRSGWYARLKGDNNDNRDPGKIRFDQIERVVVAVIY